MAGGALQSITSNFTSPPTTKSTSFRSIHTSSRLTFSVNHSASLHPSRDNIRTVNTTLVIKNCAQENGGKGDDKRLGVSNVHMLDVVKLVLSFASSNFLPLGNVLLFDKYCDKMLKRKKIPKITNCDVITKKGPITLKIYREDGYEEVISNLKVSDLHLTEWREVIQACPDKSDKGWKTIYDVVKTRLDQLTQTGQELKIDLNKPLKEQDPLNELNELAYNSQASMLMLTPLFSRVILQLHLQPQEFVTGLAMFCCMPTTLSSGVALTRLAGGNSALALAMTVFSNLLGIMIIPFTISRLIAGGAGTSIPADQLFRSLIVTLLIPLILGKVIRESFKGDYSYSTSLWKFCWAV
ncbi:probable sodium/metabolite cotransporter BASS4, chloroplastic [Tanacetum coccineum]